MNLISKTTLLLLSPLAFVSCNKETAEVDSNAPAETVAAKPYPLDVCIVSGEKLGSMGDPISIVHEGQEIKFCCDSCPPKFKKDPEKYLGKLNEASE
jgi:YHS domain-containing protein